MSEHKTYCAKCGGSGYLYTGTGHRMSGYPFAEKTAFDGVCDQCDNAGKPKKPIELESADVIEARMDAAVSRILAKLEESK